MIRFKNTFRLTSVIFAFSIFLSGTNATSSDCNCFTIAVGKNASTAGHVIMAHNEDDSPPQAVNHHKVPRTTYQGGAIVALDNGGQLEQVNETWAYLWAEMPEMSFSDSYLNEWGVCIASDACLSREDQPELTDGGIARMLRQLVAQRAKSAREGVILAGELVERFGYASSGRTYTICDPEEGWLFSAVNGKHWIARRVPDNEIAIIANTYTIHSVDLSDTLNYLASGDIIDYAVKRGWYRPEIDGAFDFAAAYANPGTAADSANFCRQWGGLRLISAEPIEPSPILPFSVTPKQKVDAEDLMWILRDHYEGTELFRVDPENGDPHHTGTRSICAATTQTSFVAELHHNMPSDIGLVYWLCLGEPCTSFYIPHYFGAPDFPKGYALDTAQPSMEYYIESLEAPFVADRNRVFWTFRNFNQKACARYRELMPDLKHEIESLENRAIELREPLERTVLELYSLDKATALNQLSNYSEELCLSAMEAMKKLAIVR